jgi:hypothetical protein
MSEITLGNEENQFRLNERLQLYNLSVLGIVEEKCRRLDEYKLDKKLEE